MKTCVFCGNKLEHVVIDLGSQPPSNSFLTKEQLEEPEVTYPLKAYVCSVCYLVQVPEIKKSSDIFNNEYIYYSSQSPANVKHAEDLAYYLVDRFKYNVGHRVLEIGSNDGYMMDHFRNYHIPCVGIEPSVKCAEIALSKGHNVITEFFSDKLTKYIDKFNLILGINVFAHMPDINDVMKGLKKCLAKHGVIVFEFPHILKTLQGNQFDQFYHEHFFYFSLTTLCKIFAMHDLKIFDVEEIPEHGGSLRIFAEHADGMRVVYDNVGRVLDEEIFARLNEYEGYEDFQTWADDTKNELLWYLTNEPNKLFCAYGAAAKANTFLNYASVKPDLIKFIVDRSPHKIGKYLPGTHIPVVSEDEIRKQKPDYVIITAWNLKDEIMEQLSYIRSWGGQFIITTPQFKVL